MLYRDLRFVQAGGHGGRRSSTQMVVIHATDNTASDEGEAQYATWRPDGTSAHFYNDEDSTIQALDTDLVAYGCYPIGNSKSVQFEMSGRSNAISDLTMRQVAPIVARVCRDYGIPLRKVSANDLRNGVKGICGHADVTAAWGEGDHTDPGGFFPWDRFIAYVGQSSGGLPTPPPPPPGPGFPLAYPPNVYGLMSGPDNWHGGYFAAERPAVKAIQQALIRKGCVPGISNPASGWADGFFEEPTRQAVLRFQAATGLGRDGLVGPATWAKLFS